MRSWLNDRFIEYLGTKEDALTNFVVNLLNEHQSARQIILQLRMVLEKDTQQFVTLLWKRLLFEALRSHYL